MAVVLLASVGYWATGCSCTLVGCVDALGITVNLDATAIAAGVEEVTVTADGTAISCTVTLPPPGNSATLGTFFSQPCSTGVTMDLGYAMTCGPVQTGTGTETECQPIEGMFTEYITLTGTPASVRVQQSVGGAVIFDQTFAPKYTIYQPNGASCGPTCHQASATLTVP